MSRFTAHENLPERCYEGGLHPIEEGLHVIEHGDEAKEAWVHQRISRTNSPTENNQSRYIGGLKRKHFWCILVIVSLVVIGASVGGAVGGSLAAKESSDGVLQSFSVQSSLPPSTEALSGATSSRPTVLPSSFVTTSCPASNNTSFTPKTPGGNPGQYNFTRHCGFDTDGQNLIEAFVLDLDTCIALCSNWNYIQSGGDMCTSVSFNVNGRPPGNCWAKTGTGLKQKDEQAAALLQ